MITYTGGAAHGSVVSTRVLPATHFTPSLHPHGRLGRRFGRSRDNGEGDEQQCHAPAFEAATSEGAHPSRDATRQGKITSPRGKDSHDERYQQHGRLRLPQRSFMLALVQSIYPALICWTSLLGY